MTENEPVAAGRRSIRNRLSLIDPKATMKSVRFPEA
jgi:hypothetical protein